MLTLMPPAATTALETSFENESAITEWPEQYTSLDEMTEQPATTEVTSAKKKLMREDAGKRLGGIRQGASNPAEKSGETACDNANTS